MLTRRYFSWYIQKSEYINESVQLVMGNISSGIQSNHILYKYAG